MSDAVSSTAMDGSIAIIGMAGRFPGAEDVRAFWSNLRAGIESVSFFTDDELRRAGVDIDALRRAGTYVPAQATVPGADMFDAAFFGINPKEAELMDPQHRLFLESAWEALEDAGYDPATYGGAIGVYGGTNKNSYFYNNVYPAIGFMDPITVSQAELANEKDFLATRVSYKLNLTGPSTSISTACSTSLVATFYAVQGLLNYQCDIALAGGATVRVPQVLGYPYIETAVMAPDGHCRPYDAQAKGTIAGSGVGIVTLKRLADAVADGDHIYAVIRGIAINNDGSAKLSFSAPNGDGQADVIAMAQAIADVDPDTITYVEGHGTGTPLGDPIEVAALTQAFRRGTARRGYCALGSVKSNFGHLEAAAGVTGLIKTAMAIENAEIPPTVHFEKPNPRLELDTTPFFVPNRLLEWKPAGVPRRAGVSSFGFGGTNAHAVVEQAPVAASEKSARAAQLICLSARSSAAVDRAAERLAAHIAAHPQLDLADAAFTLHVGRRAFDHRRFVVCNGHDDAVSALRGQSNAREVERRSSVLCFLYDTAGGSAIGVNELYAAEPVFRREIDRCLEVLRRHTPDGVSLDRIPAESAVFTVVVQHALTQLWASLGVSPKAVVGQGVGSLSAACAAGVMSLDDALLAAVRFDSHASGLAGIELRAPVIPMLVPGVTGWLTAAQARDADFWNSALQQNVSPDALSVLYDDPARAFLLVGTSDNLLPAVASHAAQQGRLMAANTAAVLNCATLFADLGVLWQAGLSIDWKAYHANEQRVRVSLPTYPFERRRFWIDRPAEWRLGAAAANGSATHEAHTSAGAAATAIQDAAGEADTTPADEAVERMEDAMTNGAAPDPNVAPRGNRITRELQDIVSDLSGISHDDLDIDTTFLELGFDSLFLTQANGEFQKRFPVKIAFRQLFEEAPTLRALADYIDTQLPPEPPQPVQVKPVPVAALRHVAPVAARIAVPSTVGATTASPDGSLEWLIEQQLRIMNEQLELLRNRTAPDT